MGKNDTNAKNTGLFGADLCKFGGQTPIYPHILVVWGENGKRESEKSLKNEKRGSFYSCPPVCAGVGEGGFDGVKAKKSVKTQQIHFPTQFSYFFYLYSIIEYYIVVYY